MALDYNLIFGTPGNDNITGTDLPDLIIADGPTYPEDGGDDVVHGGIGPDVIYGHTGDDVLDGGSGSDELYGDAGDDTLIGGIGDDVLDGGAGFDSLYGGYGNDRLIFSDHYDFDGSYDLLDGGPGYDRAHISIGSGTPVILSLADPSVDQYVGGTILRSIEKLWLYISGSGNDVVTGGAYNDIIEAGGGDDIINGGAGDDEINGGAGANILSGDEGNDVISSRGADHVYGGAGNDRIAHSDFLDGPVDPFFLDGGDGDDRIFVDSGLNNETPAPATILGGDGNDTIIYYNLGTGQEALIDGGSGIDFAQLIGFGNTEAVTFALDPLQDSILGSLTLRGIEQIQFRGGSGDDNVAGGDMDDRLSGGFGNDRLEGRGGDDNLDGGYGDDVLFGGDGDDFIVGSLGRDTIYGGAGDDIIFGSESDDVLYGGAGADIFAYTNRNDSRKGDGNRDVIKDFTVGEDKIDISSLKGDYAVVDSLTGLPGQIILKPLANGYTAINFDTDGDYKIDMQIYAFTGGAAMTAADFIL